MFAGIETIEVAIVEAVKRGDIAKVAELSAKALQVKEMIESLRSSVCAPSTQIRCDGPLPEPSVRPRQMKVARQPKRETKKPCCQACALRSALSQSADEELKEIFSRSSLLHFSDNPNGPCTICPGVFHFGGKPGQSNGIQPCPFGPKLIFSDEDDEQHHNIEGCKREDCYCMHFPDNDEVAKLLVEVKELSDEKYGLIGKKHGAKTTQNKNAIQASIDEVSLQIGSLIREIKEKRSAYAKGIIGKFAAVDVSNPSPKLVEPLVPVEVCAGMNWVNGSDELESLSGDEE